MRVTKEQLERMIEEARQTGDMVLLSALLELRERRQREDTPEAGLRVW